VDSPNLPLPISSSAGVDRNLQEVIGIEADIETRQIAQGLDEQPRAGNQHHRERDLTGHSRRNPEQIEDCRRWTVGEAGGTLRA
jgi:hypothetical protein